MLVHKTILVFVISFLSLFALGQTVLDVQKMERQYQARLDSGADMLRDARRYYLKMDSLLNVVYWRLYKSTNASKRSKLKNEQIQWIKARDKYFKVEDQKFSAKYESGEWGEDMEMVTYDAKAEFVQKRIVILIKRNR